MRVEAARLLKPGEPLEVDEVELAEPGPGEVLVELAFAGVNPVDRYGALGRVGADGPLPRTLGAEASGHLEGRPVLVRGHGLGTRRDGLWATAAIVPHQAVIPVPDGVDLQHAAAMGVVGVTAWRCFTEKGEVHPDDRVLVLGASGSVGSAIVSLARSLGVTVWGQTGSEGKAAWVRERGADQVIVGGPDAVAERASELRPTVVFDPLGGGFFAAGVAVIEPRGRIVVLGTSAGVTGELNIQQLYRKGLTVHGYAGLIEREDALAHGIQEALLAQRDGRLDVVIDRVVPLAEVNDALDLLAGRSLLGKLLLGLSGSST
jgi:NADPH2:quinone reductase